MREDDLKNLPLEDGDECPDCRLGTLRYEPDGKCSCHRSAPCWACVEAKLECDFCGGNA
jgi:hypothetical protein